MKEQQKTEYQYDLFITYSRLDYLDEKERIRHNSSVAKIVETLKANNIKYWIDIKGDYSANNDFIEKIVDRIKKSRVVLFISSQESNKSEWVKKEITFAKENKKMVIPLMIDNTPIRDSLKFLLGSIDEIYYYKNEKKALQKMVNLLQDCNDDLKVVTPAVKIRNVLAVIGIALAVFCLAFLLCFSIGFAFGYFGHRLNVEESVAGAFSKSRVSIVDDHTVLFTGEKMIVRYDLENALVVSEEKYNEKLFQNATIKDIMVTVSFSAFLQRILKNAKGSGNSKAKFAYIVAGCVGFFCGYSIGNYVGVQYAILKNDRDMEDYFKQPSTRSTLKQLINDYYLFKNQ